MPKRAAEDQYDSDDGFVEDAPKSKKSKQVKEKGTTGMQKGDDGSLFWEIPGSKRRVVISEYRGTTMVNIREYYTKDGETKPGKGIALTVDQFHDFINLLPDVGSVLKEKGFDRPWPSSCFDTGPKRKRNAESADEEDAAAAGNDKGEEEPKPAALEDSGVSKSSKSKLDKFKHQAKKNHEATSEEDED